jgi:hypothetical protein
VGTYSDGPVPPKGFPPNGFGLYDMHGNLDEWCSDTWHEDYVGAPFASAPWTRGSDERVIRGGSWHDPPVLCRSAARLKLNPTEGEDFVGIRVALSAEGASLDLGVPLQSCSSSGWATRPHGSGPRGLKTRGAAEGAEEKGDLSAVIDTVLDYAADDVFDRTTSPDGNGGQLAGVQVAGCRCELAIAGPQGCDVSSPGLLVQLPLGRWPVLLGSRAAFPLSVGILKTRSGLRGHMLHHLEYRMGTDDGMRLGLGGCHSIECFVEGRAVPHGSGESVLKPDGEETRRR